MPVPAEDLGEDKKKVMWGDMGTEGRCHLMS